MAYTRRQELTCTESELEEYGNTILYENEVLYVTLSSGRKAVKFGDGITAIKDIPYSINYDEIKEQASLAATALSDAKKVLIKVETEGVKQVKSVSDTGTAQVTAVKAEGEAQIAKAAEQADRAESEAVNAKTEADRAKEIADGVGYYTKTESEQMLDTRANQPYEELTTPADLDDSAGGLVRDVVINGVTVQKAHVANGPKDAGKYQVRTHRGFYELILPAMLSEQTLVIDPVTESGKLVDSLVVTSITMTPVSTSTAPVLPTEYIDYTPTPDVPVTPESVEKCKLESYGGNLFGGDKFLNAAVNKLGAKIESSGLVRISGSMLMDGVPIFNGFKPNTQYTIFVRGYCNYPGNLRGTNMVVKLSTGLIPLYYDATSTSDFKQIAYVNPKGTSVIAINGLFYGGSDFIDPTKFGVFEGVHTLDEFKPYTAHTYDIPLPQPLRQGDTIEEVDGRYKMAIRRVQYVFDGTESVPAYGIIGSGYRYGVVLKKGVAASKIGVGRCTHFTYSNTPIIGNDKNNCVCVYSDGICYLRMDSLDNSVLNLKAYLSAQFEAKTPVTVEYERATPQYIDLPDSTQALLRSIVTEPGVAHLWFEGTVVPIMTAEYRQDLQAYIKSVTLDSMAYITSLEAKIAQLQIGG